MSVQPDVVLAACPACGDPTVKLDHVQKCVNKLKRIKELAERIVVVNVKTSTERNLEPLFTMDYEAAKELLDIF